MRQGTKHGAVESRWICRSRSIISSCVSGFIKYPRNRTTGSTHLPYKKGQTRVHIQSRIELHALANLEYGHRVQGARPFRCCRLLLLLPRQLACFRARWTVVSAGQSLTSWDLVRAEVYMYVRVQVYIVYMGHQHEPSTELAGGFSAAKAAHHGLLNQVLDDGRSGDSFSVISSLSEKPCFLKPGFCPWTKI